MLRDEPFGRRVTPQVLLILGVAVTWSALLGVLVLGERQNAASATIVGSAPLTWNDAIGPLLSRNCVVCHGGSGNLYLDTYADALKGGQSGPAIVPGQSADSMLLRALRDVEPGLARMPLNRPPLLAADINRIAAWIDAGAPESSSSQ